MEGRDVALKICDYSPNRYRQVVNLTVFSTMFQAGLRAHAVATAFVGLATASKPTLGGWALQLEPNLLQGDGESNPRPPDLCPTHLGYRVLGAPSPALSLSYAPHC